MLILLHEAFGCHVQQSAKPKFKFKSENLLRVSY